MTADGYTRARAWGPVAAWSAVILALSVVPAGALPPLGVDYADLVLHAAFYVVLGWLLVRALGLGGATLGGAAAAALVTAVAFGGLIEWMQGFAARGPSAADWVADGAGAAAGIAGRAIHLSSRKRPR